MHCLQRVNEYLLRLPRAAFQRSGPDESTYCRPYQAASAPHILLYGRPSSRANTVVASSAYLAASKQSIAKVS